jgi:hypothetical protein
VSSIIKIVLLKTKMTGGEYMIENKGREIQYIPPKLEVLDISEVLENIGPAISCSAYGGAVTNC